ncbi:MAG: translocation/assembly module TamB [Natronospirillum sp.]|uniref:translocation/assembly module TamB domain-containing protein n=1 Tax=Natronospirillum sp. TaxID=2812955 RepID=UPI0025F0B748|nr:translocation/assembly module TamB [Natronospirillum sp.]MCH8550779.1 translocation/assembly module TamB [Natronospirillum sp.]
MGLVTQSITTVLLRTVQGFLYLLLVLLFVLLLVIGTLLGTASGRVWVAQQGLWLANETTAWQVQVNGLSSPSLTQWQADRVRVFPPGVDEAAISVDDLELRYPLNQWELAITIEELTARRVVVDLDRLRRMDPGPPREEPLDLTEAEPIELDGFGIWLERLDIGELRLTSAEGDALYGRLTGALAWPELDKLPIVRLDWQDDDTNLLLLSAQPSPDGQLWLLSGDMTLPTNTWAHAMSQWPEDTALTGRVDITADLGGQRVQINEFSFPWQGEPIELEGQVAHDQGKLGFDEVRLRVAGRESRLHGHYGPDGTRMEGELNIPMSLVRPFLPEDIAAHTLDAEDTLQARLIWPEDGRWTLEAELISRWHHHPAQIDLQAAGVLLQVEALTASARLSESVVDISGNWDLAEQRGQLQVDGRLDDDVATPYWSDPVYGGATLSGRLTGRGLDEDGQFELPIWNGTLTAEGLLPTDTALGNVPWSAEADTAFEFPSVSWSNLRLTLETGEEAPTLFSNGRYDLADQSLDVNWELDELPLGPLLAQLMDWPQDLTANLTGSGSVQGPLDDLAGRASLTAQGLLMGDAWEAELEAPLMAMDQLLVETLTAQWRDSRLSASGSVRPDLDRDWQDWPVQLDIAPLEINFADGRQLLPDWPEELAEGRVVSSLSARGRAADPDLLAQARVNARYLGESLTGSFNWQADQLQADLNWQDRFISLEGRGRPWEQGQWQLQGERLRTEDIAPWVDLPDELIEARLTHQLNLSLEGNTTDADISLRTRHQGVWDRETLAASTDVTLEWREASAQQWHLQDLQLDWGEAQLSANGQSGTEDLLPRQLDVEVQAFPLHRFLPAPEDFVAQVSGHARLDAGWPDWQVDINMDMDGEQQDQILLGRLEGLIRGREMALEKIDLSQLEIRMGDSLEVIGRGGLEDDLWDLAVDWSGLEWAPPADLPLPGSTWTGSGSLRMSGEGDDPDVRAYMDWTTRWSALDDSEALDLEFNTQLITTDEALTLTSGLRRPGRDLIIASVETPREPWLQRLETPVEDWPLAVFWSIDLSTEETLFWLGQDQLQVAGAIAGEGRFAGSLANPDIAGSLRWEDGTFRLPEVGAELDRIQISLDSTDINTINVDGSARAGDGTFTIGGNLAFEDGTLVSDLRAELDQAAVVQRPDVQSLASGVLTLTGPWPDFLLAGDLRLIGLTVNINRLTGPAVAQLEIHNEDNGNGLNGSLPIALDIGIRTDGPATIRGNGLNARLSGELRLGGTMDDLQSDGALTIESGTFNLLTRQFQLQEGQVRLIEEAIDLQIIAVHQRRDVNIEATISGSADQLQLTLRSEPSLPEDEIVAQLLFGKSVQNMTPWQALQLANAINQLRGGDSLDLFMATRETLGLDTLEVEAAGDEGEAATLRVGRYLNSRVYLELDTDLNEDRDWAGSVEVELTPNLNLETRAGTGGRSGGLELRWRRDY